MRVFVTGASGFIGSAVVRDLTAAGHTVLGLSRSAANADALRKMGAQVLDGALEDLDSLRQGAKQTDGTIHCAFIHDFSRFAQNGQIDKRAIEAIGGALEGTGKPFVVTSGTGLLAQGRLATEDDAARSGDGIPRVSEPAAFAFAPRGVRVSAIRLPQVHGGEGKAGFVGYVYEVARQKGFAAYIGDGGDRWPSVHRKDAARLYRLALEKGRAGAAYHAVADEGVTMRDIAHVIGRHLKVPVRSIDLKDAPAYFGWLSMFAGFDMPASSARTQAELGWKPREIGLIADIGEPGYFG